MSVIGAHRWDTIVEVLPLVLVITGPSSSDLGSGCTSGRPRWPSAAHGRGVTPKVPCRWNLAFRRRGTKVPRAAVRKSHNPHADLHEQQNRLGASVAVRYGKSVTQQEDAQLGEGETPRAR